MQEEVYGKIQKKEREGENDVIVITIAPPKKELVKIKNIHVYSENIKVEKPNAPLKHKRKSLKILKS